MRKGFKTYIEPDWLPSGLLEWGRYRPDVLGVRMANKIDEYAFVECETKPNPKRILAKNTSSISIQARLLRETKSSLILAVPDRELENVNQTALEGWDIWGVDRHGRIKLFSPRSAKYDFKTGSTIKR